MTILTRSGIGNPHKHIANLCWADSEGGEPDADLIAAAPDLHEALVDLLEMYDAWVAAIRHSPANREKGNELAADHFVGDSGCFDAWTAAQAALAKASGIEAATADETRSGSVHESPAREAGDAQ